MIGAVQLQSIESFNEIITDKCQQPPPVSSFGVL
jgi:hypothetical protein